MAAIRKRYTRWEKFELLASEDQALLDAVDAWEVIYDASSPTQMHAARAAYVRWATRKKNTGACTP